MGALEAAGARQLLGEQLEGQTEAYTLDGTSYTIDEASVDTGRLAGHVDQAGPVGLTVGADASASAGSAPHTFAIHGLLTGISGETAVAHTVVPPEGYRLADEQGFAEHEDCQARTQPGTENASLELEARESACPQGTAGPGAGLALAGCLIAAGFLRRCQLAP